jgi:hypothetical protein
MPRRERATELMKSILFWGIRLGQRLQYWW